MDWQKISAFHLQHVTAKNRLAMHKSFLLLMLYIHVSERVLMLKLLSKALVKTWNNHTIDSSKTWNQFGVWTFCLVIPPGTQWNHKGSAAFFFLVAVLLPRGIPHYCIICRVFLTPEDRKEPSWKASTFNDKRCSMFSGLRLQERNILYVWRLASLPICNSDHNERIQRDCAVKTVLAHHMAQECIGFTLLIPLSASCKFMLVHPL